MPASLTSCRDVPSRPSRVSSQPITAPIALEPADVAAVGLDFVPDSFVRGVVQTGAALISREGDFGFSAGERRLRKRATTSSS